MTPSKPPSKGFASTEEHPSWEKEFDEIFQPEYGDDNHYELLKVVKSFISQLLAQEREKWEIGEPIGEASMRNKKWFERGKEHALAEVREIVADEAGFCYPHESPEAIALWKTVDKILALSKE